MRTTREQSTASTGRHTLHRWLIWLAARVRPSDPDRLLDRLRPDGAIARTFLDAGLAQLRAGRTDAARDILERGALAFPEHLALIQSAASLARESGRFGLALAYWDAAMEQAPGDARTACGLSASLRATFQPARASSIIEAAVERFPSDVVVIAEAARVAALRGRYERSLELWNRLIANGATSPEVVHGRVEALAGLGRFADAQATAIKASGLVSQDSDFEATRYPTAWRDDGDASASSGELDPTQDPSIQIVSITHGELMLEFESLGDNCEFGLVQRYCGVEPLGLFRFTESQAAHLDHAFSTRFEEYGTDEDLIIGHLHGDEEYLGASRYYGGFKYHTEACAPGVDEAELRKTELRKLAYLKQRMLSNLQTGEKIFVRKQGNYPAAMDLSRTIRGMGPNIFLWVEPADNDHPVGYVESVEPGLLKGYVSKFAWYGDARALALHDWLKMCLNALGVVKRLEGHRVRYKLPDNRILQTGMGWDIGPRCHSVYVESPKFDVQRVEKLTLLEDTDRRAPVIASQCLEAAVSAGSQVVVSVWVFVPTTFRGAFIEVYFSHAPEGYVSRADLEQREVWQRIYATTKMPKGRVSATVDLRITGFAQDVVYVANWRLEQGFVPIPWAVG